MSVSSNSSGPVPISPTEVPVRGGRQNIIDYTNRVKAWLDSLSPSGEVHDTGWEGGVALATGFEDYGGSFGTVKYRRVGRMVMMRGLVRATSQRNTGTTHTMVNLPVGIRPSFAHLFTCLSSTSAGQARVDALASGPLALNLTANGAVALPAGGYISLAGVWWMID